MSILENHTNDLQDRVHSASKIPTDVSIITVSHVNVSVYRNKIKTKGLTACTIYINKHWFY